MTRSAPTGFPVQVMARSNWVSNARLDPPPPVSTAHALVCFAVAEALRASVCADTASFFRVHATEDVASITRVRAQARAVAREVSEARFGWGAP